MTVVSIGVSGRNTGAVFSPVVTVTRGLSSDLLWAASEVDTLRYYCVLNSSPETEPLT